MGSGIPTQLNKGLERWLTFALALWGAGVQLGEAIADAGMAATAVGVLVDAWSRRGQLALAPRLRAWWPLWAFVAWALLAPAIAGHPPTSAAASRLLHWVAIPFAARAIALLSRRRHVHVAIACAAVLCLSCLAAVLQHFGVWPSEEAFAAFAWTRIPFQRVYEPVPGDPTRFMAGGLLLHRLKFANVSGMAVLWALALSLGSAGWQRRIGFVVAAGGLLAVVTLPHARAASVALVLASTAVLLALLPNRTKALALGGALAAAALVAVLAIPSLRERFSTSLTDQGSGERRYFIEAGLRALREHPIAGVGLGRFRPSLYPAADMPPEVLEHGGKTHNQLLSVAVEIGIPGALLLLMLLAWLWRRTPGRTPAGAAARGCVLFIALLSFLHDPLFHSEVSMAFALALGIGLVESKP